MAAPLLPVKALDPCALVHDDGACLALQGAGLVTFGGAPCCDGLGGGRSGFGVPRSPGTAQHGACVGRGNEVTFVQWAGQALDCLPDIDPETSCSARHTSSHALGCAELKLLTTQE